MWINHWSLLCMASATPDLRLSSQPLGITASYRVQNYTVQWQRHMCVNNLPKVVTWKRKAGSRTRDIPSRKSNALTTAPLAHTGPDHYHTDDNIITRRHSVQRIPPPRHIELGTVSLPASTDTSNYIMQHCVATGFSNFTFQYHIFHVKP